MDCTRLSSSDLHHSIGYHSKYLDTAEINKKSDKNYYLKGQEEMHERRKTANFGFCLFCFLYFCFALLGNDTVTNVISIYSLYTVMDFLKTFSFVYIIALTI